MGDFVNPSNINNRLYLFLDDTDAGRGRLAVPDAYTNFAGTSDWRCVMAIVLGPGSSLTVQPLPGWSVVGTPRKNGTNEPIELDEPVFGEGRQSISLVLLFGQLDEIQVSATARSARWIATGHKN